MPSLSAPKNLFTTILLVVAISSNSAGLAGQNPTPGGTDPLRSEGAAQRNVSAAASGGSPSWHLLLGLGVVLVVGGGVLRRRAPVTRARGRVRRLDSRRSLPAEHGTDPASGHAKTG